MLKKIRQHICDNQLFGDGDKVLLAVSGGPDSVAMADMMHRMHVCFGICHVNFHLRGADSDADEEFVRHMAEGYGVQLFVLQADTQAYASKHGVSIEMAARDIRYSEFHRIMDQYGYSCTAVAHHQDDAIETLILNLTRGAGIRGLAGIKVKNGKIVRPIMCLSRSEIMQYLQERSLPYRTDLTNLESNYARNKVRNLIMPVLEQINPSARASMAESIRYLGMAQNIYAQDIARAASMVTVHQDNTTRILIDRLMEYTEPECLLYETISQYGFGKHQCASIMRGITGESGRIFGSKTHRIIKDRQTLIIETLPSGESIRRLIQPSELIPGTIRTPHHTLEISRIEPDQFHPIRDAATIFLDYHKLMQMEMPLQITGWQPGDHMTVFGGKRKKLSDIFVDSKLNISQKENAEILRAGNTILWAVGIRASNMCLIDNTTTDILKITAK